MKSDTPVATPLSNNNKQKGIKTSFSKKKICCMATSAVLLLSAVAGWAMYIYGLKENSRLSRQLEALNLKDYKFLEEPSEPGSETDVNHNYLLEHLKSIVSESTGISLDDIKSDTYGELIYHPNYLKVGFRLHDYYYSTNPLSFPRAYFSFEERDDADELVEKIKEKLISEGYSKTADENFFSGSGIYSSQEELCEARAYSQSAGGITCGNAEFFPEEGSSLANEINELADAIERKTGTLFEDTIIMRAVGAWGDESKNNIYIDNGHHYVLAQGDMYEIVEGVLHVYGSARFYRKINPETGEKTKWSYALCGDNAIMTEEDQKLYTCSEDKTAYSSYPIWRDDLKWF